jgi:hypothetical protein
MMTEGVGETSRFADALSLLRSKVLDQPAPLIRLLHALQYCGHFILFSTLPAALASFHSAPYFFCRSRIAIMSTDGSFFGLASFVMASFLAGSVYAAAVFISTDSAAAIIPAAITAAKMTLYIVHRPLVAL